MIKRTSVLIYGVLSYALFFGVFTYAILFIGNIGVSPSLDSPGSTSLGTALLIDVGLLAAFALQHSIMARPGFKRLWTRIVPKPMERSTFVLAASLLLGATVYFWQPLGDVIWQVENTSAIIAIYTLFVTGWAMVLTASFLINHFDLFGLRQVWLYFRIRHAVVVSLCASSALCRIPDWALGSTDHDGSTPGLFPSLYGLYLHWCHAGRT